MKEICNYCEGTGRLDFKEKLVAFAKEKVI